MLDGTESFILTGLVTGFQASNEFASRVVTSSQQKLGENVQRIFSTEFPGIISDLLHRCYEAFGNVWWEKRLTKFLQRQVSGNVPSWINQKCTK